MNFASHVKRSWKVSRVRHINPALPVLVVLLSAVGLVALTSAAGGNFELWAQAHGVRLAAGLAVLVAAIAIDLETWRRMAIPAYLGVLALLVAVLLFGDTAMGAKRWLSYDWVRLQPSEFMKIAVVLALAAYYHEVPEHQASRPSRIVIPLLILAAPCALIAKQPDLGTAVIVLAGGLMVLFAAGLHWAFFGAGAVACIAAVPVLWHVMHDYQKQRILTFLDPSRDPLGSGYHILQSKIALGSGGLFGKGLAAGTQSQLNFLPEKHTDFIFTVLAEETGFLGTLALLSIYAGVLALGFHAAYKVRSRFARLLAVGICATLFLYVFINVAMVTGLVPVVGVPLPLVSFGGTAVVAVMLAFGLLINVSLHRALEGRRKIKG